jgi:hypothetical protein
MRGLGIGLIDGEPVKACPAVAALWGFARLWQQKARPERDLLSDGMPGLYPPGVG